MKTGIVDIDAHVGTRLRELREKQDLTQQALAERADITFQQIQKYENGEIASRRAGSFSSHKLSMLQLTRFLRDCHRRLPFLITKEARDDFSNLVAFARSRDGQDCLPLFVR